MHNLKNIAKELKRLRENLTKKEFARRLGVEYRTYLRYEAGETPPPKTVIILAMYMSKITPNYTLLLESGYTNLEKISCFIKNIELDSDQGGIKKILPIYKEEDPETAGLLSMTREILKSDTDYSASLAANIRSFHHAIKTEKRLNGIDNDMSEMKNIIKELTGKIKGIKQNYKQTDKIRKDDSETEKGMILKKRIM